MDKRKPAWWKWLRQVAAGCALWVARYRWYRKNQHNETTACNSFDQSHVRVGNYTYGSLRVVDGPGPGRLTIGSYCSIAEGVAFILNGDHRLDSLSTFPFRAFVLGQIEIPQSRGHIILEDDVWLGYGAVILSGVNIGQGAVVAAGAVVTKDCPPYSIVAGVPAKVIGYRFTDEVRTKLSRLRVGAINAQMVREHIDQLEGGPIEAAISLLESASHGETERAREGR